MRYIKPSFWTDGKIVRLSPFARLLYIGCWNFALCDLGHLPDDPYELKLQILPADPVDAAELVEELVAAGRLQRVTAGGRAYLLAHRLPDHQKTDKRWEARCPACAAASQCARPAEPPGTSPPPVEAPPFSPDPHPSRPDSPELPETPPASPQEGMGGEGSRRTTGAASGERAPKPPPKSRAPDPLWDAVMAVCGIDSAGIPDSARGAYNRAVGDLRKLQAHPLEVARRGAMFRKHWPGITLTPTALARRWGEVAKPPPTPEPRAAPTQPTAHARLWNQAAQQRGAAS